MLFPYDWIWLISWRVCVDRPISYLCRIPSRCLFFKVLWLLLTCFKEEGRVPMMQMKDQSMGFVSEWAHVDDGLNCYIYIDGFFLCRLVWPWMGRKIWILLQAEVFFFVLMKFGHLAVSRKFHCFFSEKNVYSRRPDLDCVALWIHYFSMLLSLQLFQLVDEVLLITNYEAHVLNCP